MARNHLDKEGAARATRSIRSMTVIAIKPVRSTSWRELPMGQIEAAAQANGS